MFAAQMGNAVKVVKIDTEKYPNLSSRYAVQVGRPSLPAFSRPSPPTNSLSHTHTHTHTHTQVHTHMPQPSLIFCRDENYASEVTWKSDNVMLPLSVQEQGVPH
jgi:hypothetical protein